LHNAVGSSRNSQRLATRAKDFPLSSIPQVPTPVNAGIRGTGTLKLPLGLSCYTKYFLPERGPGDA